MPMDLWMALLFSVCTSVYGWRKTPALSVEGLRGEV